MNSHRLVALTLLAVLCTACGSTPRTEYYLLAALAPPGAEARGDGPSLGIAGLRVAEYLQRPEVATLESANRLRLRDYARWAEPVGDGIERTLVLNLASLLDSGRVRARPGRATGLPSGNCAWTSRASMRAATPRSWSRTGRSRTPPGRASAAPGSRARARATTPKPSPPTSARCCSNWPNGSPPR